MRSRSLRNPKRPSQNLPTAGRLCHWGRSKEAALWRAGAARPEVVQRACIRARTARPFLVPKLRLGTASAKLRFASVARLETEFLEPRSQTEFWNEFKSRV